MWRHSVYILVIIIITTFYRHNEANKPLCLLRRMMTIATNIMMTAKTMATRMIAITVVLVDAATYTQIYNSILIRTVII